MFLICDTGLRYTYGYIYNTCGRECLDRPVKLGLNNYILKYEILKIYDYLLLTKYKIFKI